MIDMQFVPLNAAIIDAEISDFADGDKGTTADGRRSPDD
jgi:hypothetical protein